MSNMTRIVLFVTVMLFMSLVCAAPMAQMDGQVYQMPKNDPFVIELATEATKQIELREDESRQVLFVNVEQAEATVDGSGRSYEIRFIAGKTNCLKTEKCDEYNVEQKTLYLASIHVPANAPSADYEISVLPLREIPWPGAEASGYGCKFLNCGIE